MAGKATRLKYAARTECNLIDPVLVVGSFELDGNDNDPVNVRGEGFLVTHSGDNDYLITFSEKYPGMVSFVATPEASAAGNADADDITVAAEPYDSSAGTLVVRIGVGQIKADTKDGPRINFVCYFHKYSTNNVTYA